MLTLHQFEIEKIEAVGDLCKNLKILFFQNNLIEKIGVVVLGFCIPSSFNTQADQPPLENLHKLKALKYLNLALNNIVTIEGLSSCESLQKLDLTVNFIEDLLCVENLKDNFSLTELYLTGNPCTDDEGYRPFVVATLPQLESLDGQAIEKTERIIARQRHPALREHFVQLSQQKKRVSTGAVGHEASASGSGSETTAASDSGDQGVPAPSSTSEPEDNADAGAGADAGAPEPYTRESRTKMYREIATKRDADEIAKQEEEAKKAALVIHKAADIEVVWKDGQVMQTNVAQIPFKWGETEDHSALIFELSLSKYLDSSLIDVDVQPTYIRAAVKGTPIIIRTPVEVCPDTSTAERARTTGVLLLTLPKAQLDLSPGVIPVAPVRKKAPLQQIQPPILPKSTPDGGERRGKGKGERDGLCDYRNIVKTGQGGLGGGTESDGESSIDERDVPDLE